MWLSGISLAKPHPNRTRLGCGLARLIRYVTAVASHISTFLQVLICVGGADMKVRDPDLGRTALHFAVLNDHPDIVR